MWLNLVATGVTILSHFQEKRSTKGYLGNCQRGLVQTLTPTLNDWPGWSCMMQQLEAAFLVVWVGVQHRDAHLLTHAEPQSLGVSARAHPADRLSPSVLVSLFGWKAGRPVHGCMQYLLHPNWQPFLGRSAQCDRAFPSQTD